MKKYDLIIASGATICYNKLAKDFCAFKTGHTHGTTNCSGNTTQLFHTTKAIFFGDIANFGK